MILDISGIPSFLNAQLLLIIVPLISTTILPTKAVLQNAKPTTLTSQVTTAAPVPLKNRCLIMSLEYVSSPLALMVHNGTPTFRNVHPSPKTAHPHRFTTSLLKLVLISVLITSPTFQPMIAVPVLLKAQSSTALQGLVWMLPVRQIPSGTNFS